MAAAAAAAWAGATAVAASSAVSADATCLEVVLLDAVVYAGATDYVVETKNGTMISLRQSNEPGAPPIDVPPGLLADGPDGPPGPNPAQVGRPMDLCVTISTGAVALRHRR